MAIALLSETVVPLRDVAKRTPFRVHLSTLHRWRLRGVRGIKLETALLGGARVTSLEALERFSRRLSDLDDRCSPERLPSTTRRRQIANSEVVLDRAGI
jgi:hypothetical protein